MDEFFDVRSLLPVKEHLKPIIFNEYEEGSLWDPDGSNYPKVYSHLYEEGEQLLIQMDEYIEKLDDMGIVKKGIYNAEPVIDKISEYPDKFIPYAHIDLSNSSISNIVLELEDKVKNKGYKAVDVQPFIYGHKANSKKLYPVYQKAEELGVPVWIHTSVNFSHEHPIRMSHPSHLHDVCRDFPELPVIAGHAMWPWVSEGCAMLWKHENMYADLSAVRIKYIAENSDWAPLLEYGRSVISDSILFGVGWPLVSDEIQTQEMNGLDLSQEVKEKWSYDNASNIFS